MTYVLDRSVGTGVIVKPDAYREIREYLQVYFTGVPAGNAGNVRTEKKGDHDGFL